MGLLVWEQQRWAWLETTAGKPASSWRNTQQLPGGLQAPEVASQILFQGEGGERLRIPGSAPLPGWLGPMRKGPPGEGGLLVLSQVRDVAPHSSYDPA